MSELVHLLRTALFVTPLSTQTVVYAVVGTVVALLLWQPLVHRTGWSALPTLLALLALTAVLALTLAPGSVDYVTGVRACIAGAPRHLRAQLLAISTSPEALLNTVLLVPLGMFGVLAVRRVWPVALFVVLLPAAIELAQTRVPGRVCSGIDYLTNAAGGLLGVLLGWLVLWVYRSTRREPPGAVSR